MAITYVDKFSGSDAFGASIVASIPAGGIAAGSFVAIAGTCQDSSFDISSLTDTQGNTYTVHSTTRQTNGGTAALVCSGQIATGLASGNTITATLAGATGGSITGGIFTGIASSSAFDQFAKASIAFDTVFSSGATPTTTQADELAFGLNYANNSGITFTPTGGYSEIADDPYFGAWREQIQYLIVSATGAQTSTATASGAVAGMAIVATFKASAAPPSDTGLAWIRA